jgi:hypothetical protein
MRAAVNFFATFVITFAVCVAVGCPLAAAEEDSQESGKLFVPSFHVISGVTIQEWDATVSSEICRGCTFPSASAEILRPSVDGNDRDVTPYVGGGLELMSPALPMPGGLRLFIGGEFAAAFGTDRNVAREGDPGLIGNPAPAAAPNQPFDEDVATGQGSLTKATMDHFTYGAHAGVAIPLELFGRRIHLKPAVAWMQYRIEIEGEIADAECFQPPFGQLNQCNALLGGSRFLRPITMTAETDETFDGIGPALDIEMDTGRYGPIGSSLFVGVRVYNILGDRKVELSSPVLSFNDPVGVDQTRSRFTFEVDPWIYRVGAGMRFQWLGYDR